MPQRHAQPLSLLQAAQEAPVLARLAELGRESQARLQAIQTMLPAVLQSAVKAGPIEGTNWCLIVNNNNTAAKIRQLLPAMTAHLRSKGWQVDAIRLKVLASGGN